MGKAHCHDEKTARGSTHVRGLLCSTCNTGIGLLKENPERLRRAADYVEKFDREGVNRTLEDYRKNMRKSIKPL